MQNRELKLDPLFTAKFFTLPPAIKDTDIQLDFPLPSSDVSKLKEFLALQGRNAPPSTKGLTFYQGVNKLIDTLLHWCIVQLGDEFDCGKVLAVLRNHFQFDDQEADSLYVPLLSLYKNGVVYLAKINSFIHSDIPLEFRKQVIRQLMCAFQEEICGAGCNLNLYEAYLQFISDLPIQLMFYRKKVSENVMLELMLKNKKIPKLDEIYQIHFAIVPSVYFAEEMGTGGEEKEDKYSQPVLDILLANKIMPAKKEEETYYEVANIVRNEFPQALSKSLTPENLIDFLFTLSIPVIKQEEKTASQITLLSTVDSMYQEINSSEILQQRADHHYNWLCELLKYFGEDKEFSFTEVFESTVEAEEILADTVYSFNLTNPVLLNDTLVISLLHRLKSLGYFNLIAKVEMIGGNELHMFPNNHVTCCYVYNPIFRTRTSYLRYVLDEVIEDDLEETYKNFSQLLASLSSLHQLQLLDKVLQYLFCLKKLKVKDNNLLDAILQLVFTRADYVTALLTDPNSKVNLLEVAAKYNKQTLFTKLADKSCFTIEGKLFITYHMPFAARSNKLLQIALDNKNWQIANRVLQQYKSQLNKLCDISFILICAMEHDQSDILQAYYDVQDFLYQIDKDQTYKSAYLVRKQLCHAVVTIEDFREENHVRGLVELFQLGTDAPLALERALKHLNKTILAKLLRLQLDGQTFYAYCLQQSQLTALEYLSESLSNDVIAELINPEVVLTKILQFKNPHAHIQFLIPIYRDEPQRIYGLLQLVLLKKQVNVEEVVLLGMRLLQQDKAIRLQFLHSMVLPRILLANLHMLLEKLFVENLLQPSDCLTRDEILGIIKTNNSWDCFAVFYQKIPDFMQVEDSLPLQAAQAKRMDIAAMIYKQNPSLKLSILKNYDRSIDDYLVKNTKLSTVILLLLDVCQYRCGYDFKTWLMTSQYLLLMMTQNMDDIITIKFKDKKPLLNFLFQPGLYEFILPFLSDKTLLSKTFLSHLYLIVTNSETTELCCSVLIDHPDILQKVMSVPSDLRTDAVMRKLLQLVSHTKMYDTKSILPLVQLHNNFTYAVIPYDLIYSLFEKAIWQNDIVIVNEILNSQSNNPFSTTKVNKQPTFTEEEQTSFAILFKSLESLILTHQNLPTLPKYSCQEFLDRFPRKFYDEILSRALKMRPYFRVALCKPHNEFIFLEILQRAFAPMVEKFFLDDVIKDQFENLLSETNNKVLLINLLVSKAFFILESVDYRDKAKLFLTKFDSPYLSVTVAAHENIFKTYEESGGIVDALLNNGICEHLYFPTSTSNLKYFNLLEKLIFKMNSSNRPTGGFLLLLHGRVALKLVELFIFDEFQLLQFAAAIEKIECFKHLMVDTLLDLSSFNWNYYPNDASKIRIALEALHEAMSKGEPSAKHYLLQRLSAILNSNVPEEKLEEAYQNALQKLQDENILINFRTKVDLLMDNLSRMNPAGRATFFSPQVNARGIVSRRSRAMTFKSVLGLCNKDIERKIFMYAFFFYNPVEVNNRIKKKLKLTLLESPQNLLERSIIAELGNDKWSAVKTQYVQAKLGTNAQLTVDALACQELVSGLRRELITPFLPPIQNPPRVSI